MAALGAVCLMYRTGAALVWAGTADKAALDQAIIFSVINAIVEGVLVFSFGSFLLNGREQAFTAVMIKTTAALTGMAATQVFCNRMICWKQAVASVAVSNFTTRWVFSILHPTFPLPPVL